MKKKLPQGMQCGMLQAVNPAPWVQVLGLPLVGCMALRSSQKRTQIYRILFHLNLNPMKEVILIITVLQMRNLRLSSHP